MGTRVLVTGGAGFIGCNLVRALLARGDAVVCFDDFSSGLRSNLRGLDGDLAVVEGNLIDRDALDRAMKGATYVLHEAAVPSVPRSMEDPITSHDANSRGTLNVLMAARDAGVRRVVYAASSSAYGDTEVLPKVETMPTRPLSPYAADKLHGEHLCQVFASGFGLETVALRYFNVFGPRQRPDSDYAAAIPRFVNRLLAGEKPTVYGDGTQSRDFTFIDNVVDLNLRALTAEGVSGEVFNAGIGERIDLNTLIATVAEILGVEAEIDYAPTRAGDVKHSLAAIDKARRLLGYEPVADLRTGLESTIEWYRSLRQEGKA